LTYIHLLPLDSTSRFNRLIEREKRGKGKKDNCEGGRGGKREKPTPLHVSRVVENTDQKKKKKKRETLPGGKRREGTGAIPHALVPIQIKFCVSRWNKGGGGKKKKKRERLYNLKEERRSTERKKKERKT